MAHQGQIIAFAEFSCSQSEAIKHTRGLMGHTDAPTGTSAGPSAWRWNPPPPLMCLRTGGEGKGGGEGTLSRRSQRKKSKGPRWTPKHELGTCYALRAGKAASCWGQDKKLGKKTLPSLAQAACLTGPRQPPRICPLASVQTPCLLPEESGASNQALGKQFFNLNCKH